MIASTPPQDATAPGPGAPHAVGARVLAAIAVALLAGCASGGSGRESTAPSTLSRVQRGTCATEAAGVELAMESYQRTYGGPAETIGQLRGAGLLEEDSWERFTIVDQDGAPTLLGTGDCRGVGPVER